MNENFTEFRANVEPAGDILEKMKYLGDRSLD